MTSNSILGEVLQVCQKLQSNHKGWLLECDIVRKLFKVDIGQRKCKFCQDIEDERHEFSCHKYKKNICRKTLYEKISENVPNFINLNDENKFIYILSIDDENVKDVARYISNVMDIRKTSVE